MPFVCMPFVGGLPALNATLLRSSASQKCLTSEEAGATLDVAAPPLLTKIADMPATDITAAIWTDIQFHHASIE